MAFDVSKITFSDLRPHFGTGRSFLISGTGRDRVYGYRVGVKCNLGDIEEAEWISLAKALISRSGEQLLFSQLFSFMSQHNYTKDTKTQLEKEVLDLHTRRIFDDEEWIYFIAFNQKYRPQRLETAVIRRVICDCCKKPGITTQGIIDRPSNKSTQTIPCPICGRWSTYQFADIDIDAA